MKFEAWNIGTLMDNPISDREKKNSFYCSLIEQFPFSVLEKDNSKKSQASRLSSGKDLIMNNHEYME